MQLKSGIRLGPYEITAPIGAGGMGEVYRARDTRLDRSVAIKILGPEFSAVPSLRARFEREARSISQLTHPNICALYDVDLSATDSHAYLVMEYLEGESLADRLTKGPLPMPQLLRVGREIASALALAHRHGIVHRDLKPGNIMLTKSGAKLLDFGLAKAREITLEHDAPTVQRPLTAEGTIVGTFQYMAPEQLEGGAVDFRSDIFALGAVLYEMASGRRAFDGKTKTSLIAAIVAREPEPLAASIPSAAPAFEKVVRACLAKEPDARLQSAQDVAIALGWSEQESGAPAGLSSRRSWAVAAVAAFILLAFGIGGSYLFLARKSKAREPLSFTLSAPRQTRITRAAVSPDGTMLAFNAWGSDGIGSMWVRSLPDPEPRLLATDSGGVPFWSPDGKWIAFFDDRALWKLSISGGERQEICKTGYGVGAAWLEDGTILFAPRFGEGLQRVSASGGSPQSVTKLSGREKGHTWPVSLRDGDHFLYLVFTGGEQSQVFVGSLTDPSLRKRVATVEALIGYSKPFLLFLRANEIFAQRFDTESMSLTGEPVKIAANATYEENNVTSHATVSSDGALLYSPVVSGLVRMGLYDRNGRFLRTVLEVDNLESARYSPDRQKIAFSQFDTVKGASDIHVLDLKRGIRTRVTTGLSNNRNPFWSRDGAQIYFESDRGGSYDVFVQADDGSTPARAIWTGGVDKSLTSQSPDGRYFLGVDYTPENGNDVWLVPLVEGEKPRPLLSTTFGENSARLSPDGAFLAFCSNRTGKREAYIQAYPQGRALQISSAGAEEVDFLENGELYYASADFSLRSVRYRPTAGGIEAEAPVLLFRMPKDTRMVSVAPDGEGFLMGVAETLSDFNRTFVYTRGWKESIEE